MPDSVYGKMLSDKEIEKHLTPEVLDSLRLNSYNDKILSVNYSEDLALKVRFLYITIANSLRSKWHLADVGVIPRKSRWTQILDGKRQELLEK